MSIVLLSTSNKASFLVRDDSEKLQDVPNSRVLRYKVVCYFIAATITSSRLLFQRSWL